MFKPTFEDFMDAWRVYNAACKTQKYDKNERAMAWKIIKSEQGVQDKLVAIRTLETILEVVNDIKGI